MSGTNAALEKALSTITSSGIKLNKNFRGEISNLIDDISRRENLQPEDVLDAPALDSILRDVQLNGPQKLARLKDALTRLRYPTYAAALDEFRRGVRELNLDPRLKITPSPFFEETAVTVEFTYSGPDELAKIVESLRRLQKTDVIANALEAAEDIC